MSSFFSILEDAAEESPDKPLFIFPETRWQPEERLTYGELLTEAGVMAGCLEKRTRPGDRVLLLFPTGSGFWKAFFGCLRAGVIAVPLRVPNLNRTSDHLERVCRDCTPSVVMTDATHAELLRRRADRHPYFDGRSVLVAPEASCESVNLNRPSQLAGSIAFLQYTSGSTSQPKGVQITHENLIANATMIRDRMQIRVGEDRTVTWLPHYHDMGLVGTYLETLFTQNTAWCLPPEDFALQPERWLRLISAHRASVCGAPDFAYRMCVERVCARADGRP